MVSKLRNTYRKSLDLMRKSKPILLKNVQKSFSKAINFVKAINWKSPKLAVGAGVLTLAIVGLGFFLDGATGAFAIEVGGQRVAIVKSEADAQNILNAVLAEKGKPVGQIAFTKDKVSIDPVRVKKYELQTESTARQELSDILDTFVKGYVITVNEQRLFTLGSKSQAEEILQNVKNKYAEPAEQKTIELVEFGQPVEVVEIDIKLDQVDQADKVLEELTKGKVNTTAYQIRQGDSLWTIARNNDMYIKDLLETNPGLSEQNLLKIGQKVDIVRITPYLDVIVKGTQTREEVIPFSTQYKSDGSLGPGQTKTIAQGAHGAKDVSFRFVAKNGSMVEKTVLSETVKQKPVSQVVAKGPALPRVNVAASRGSGSVSGMVWPLRGPITSGFGSRRGGFHSGLDIDGNTGDTFYAAMGGTVILAAWEGGYGKSIVIDHGNGVQTRYGHASALLVTAGQQVSTGKAIGLVGNTGNSYGSHLHFEVIVNGNKVNPLNYL